MLCILLGSFPSVGAGSDREQTERVVPPDPILYCREGKCILLCE
jgi:hypothetical protein